MSLKALLAVYAATAAFICANFLFLPEFWIDLYGARADAQAVFLYRLIAALFGGLAALAWFGRASAPSRSCEAVVRGLIVVNALATVIAVLGAVTGVYNRFAWGPVSMFAAFTYGFIVLGTESPGALQSA